MASRSTSNSMASPTTVRSGRSSLQVAHSSRAEHESCTWTLRFCCNARFARRLMIFVSEDSKANFVNKCDGLLPLAKIEMLVCDDLPAHMRAKIDRIQALARMEVGDKGKLWKLGGKRR